MSQACESDSCCVIESTPKPLVGAPTPQPKAEEPSTLLKEYFIASFSTTLLLAGIVLNQFNPSFYTEPIRLLLFAVAYLPVGGPVVWRAIKLLPKGNIFNEFLLMSIATLGAFALGEYAEAVAVMLFYAVGELFQSSAVSRAKRSIKSLLQVQAREVTVLERGKEVVLKPEEVAVGSTIRVKPGEKVPLDGRLLTGGGQFNTAALTGESVPRTLEAGHTALAGMINLNQVNDITVSSRFEDTRLSKVLAMVQEAVTRKARTQRFISRFAKVYTPIVFFLAVALTFIPYFFADPYVFEQWLYRALVFLVISCPCALVVSIPLGFFGGIGAASRYGILFKGSNYLDQMRKLHTLAMDKTGTITKGVFTVQQVNAIGIAEDELLDALSALEHNSTHPVAKAIVAYHTSPLSAASVEEIPGHGLRGSVGGKEVLAGNIPLLEKMGIAFDPSLREVVETTVAVAIDGQYRGYVVIADEIKEDAKEAIAALHREGVQRIVMLSGDKNSIVQKIAREVGIDQAWGDLLPEDKVARVEELRGAGNVVAFAGDGINDAPAIALSDIGIAMGGLGSDASIETADVVIQTDQPSRVATAIRISRKTHSIVWQNIGLAFGVKMLVLILGAWGLASMWEAVFADVGVALLAILNAVRIQRSQFQ